jgi:RecA/RadA recombinase
MKTKDLKDALMRRTVETPIEAKDLLSTGSTNLNLACSGKPTGGIPKGTYVFMPGQSKGGKTWITMAILAEAMKSRHFKGYRLIRKDTERGALMDIPAYFGQELANTIEWADYPNTHEAMYDYMDDLVKKGDPFIKVVDSEAGLQSEAMLKHFEEKKKGKTAGSYAGSGQKTHSQRIRTVVNELEKTGSILIITGQTRHNMGMGAMFEPEVAVGGDALLFWAHLQIWCRRAGKMKKRVNGKDRKVGDKVSITVAKSRVTGKERTVKLYIPNDFGIDDTGSMIAYLLEEKKANLLKKELGVSGDLDSMAVEIEKQGKERELRRLVKDVWSGIEAECTVRRKPRYQ